MSPLPPAAPGWLQARSLGAHHGGAAGGRGRWHHGRGRPDSEGHHGSELPPGSPLAGAEDTGRPQHTWLEASTFIWTGNDSRFV